MKHILISAALILSATFTKAQTPSEPFSKIDLKSIGKIYLKQGDSISVTINTTGKSEDIKTKVRNNTLEINSNTDAEYFITMKNIDALEVSGSGEIVGDNMISSDALSLDVSGNGKMTLQIATKKLNADISGIGKLTLSGNADETHIEISGSGKVDAFDLKIIDCAADISGVGKCNVDVQETLTTNISGMGSVNYKTKPKNLTENISGLGKSENRDASFADDSLESDTTKLKFGNTDILFISHDKFKVKHNHKQKSAKPIWSGLELGFNNYIYSDGKTPLPASKDYLDLNDGKSVSVSLNVFQKDFQFGKSNVWFFTGLGLTWNNYRFDKNVLLDASGPKISGIRDTNSLRSYEKSKLTATYLMAPLMFEVFTSGNKKKAFHFGAGALVGYRLGSHSKVKFTEDGSTSKPKKYDDFYLNDFRYGARIAAGYGSFNVFGDYYASTLFEGNKGPILYPVNFGITFVGF